MAFGNKFSFKFKTIFILAITIAIVLLSSNNLSIIGNSGPTYWQEYPSSVLMSLDENTPIEVVKEDLFYDFSDCFQDNTICGKVIATYEMRNPTDEVQIVNMALPYVGVIDNYFPEDVSIRVDDKVIPYEMYLGDTLNFTRKTSAFEKTESFKFENITKDISSDLYSSRKFKADEKGKLYTINIKPENSQEMSLSVEFELDSSKTNVVTSGFNSYKTDGNKIELTNHFYMPSVFEIFVLGDDINFDMKAYFNDEKNVETDLYVSYITTEEKDVYDYLINMSVVNFKVIKDTVVSDLELYNFYAKMLDKYLTKNNGYCTKEEILQEETFERILTLVYQVEFPPYSTRNISINYKDAGTMDRSKGNVPTYTFEYMLNLASRWSKFGNFNIKIIPPKEAPYLIDSSIDFERTKDGEYIANLKELPSKDLYFTLCFKDEIEFTTQIQELYKNNILVIIITVTILLLVLGTFVIKIIRKFQN